jgi:hypothetical protein
LTILFINLNSKDSFFFVYDILLETKKMSDTLSFLAAENTKLKSQVNNMTCKYYTMCLYLKDKINGSNSAIMPVIAELLDGIKKCDLSNEELLQLRQSCTNHHYGECLYASIVLVPAGIAEASFSSLLLPYINDSYEAGAETVGLPRIIES